MNYELMTIDELWAAFDALSKELSKVAAERQKIQTLLNQLGAIGAAA